MEEQVKLESQKKVHPNSEKITSAAWIGLIVFGIIIIIGYIGQIIFFEWAKKWSSSLTAMNVQNKPEITAPSQSMPKNLPAPTEDPTSNWKTYTNIKYNYSIQYPPDSVLRTQKTNRAETITIMNPKQDKVYIFISTYHPSAILPSKEINNTVNDSMYAWVNSVSELSPNYTIRSLFIDNHDAAVIEFLDNRGNIFYIKKSPYSIIQINSPNKTNSDAREIFNQILSTFKFTY